MFLRAHIKFGRRVARCDKTGGCLGLLASRSKQMSEFPISDRPCLRRKGAKALKKMKTTVGACGLPDAHTPAHTCAQVHKIQSKKARKQARKKQTSNDLCSDSF